MVSSDKPDIDKGLLGINMSIFVHTKTVQLHRMM